MKDCKHTNIVPVQVDYHGMPAFRDECADCGCIMVPDWNNPVDGIIPMVAQPMGKLINLADYRKQKEEKNKGVVNG